MANSELDLRIKTAVDASNSATTLAQLRKSLKDLNDLSVEFGNTSPEAFKKVNLEAGKVKDRLGDIKSATKAVSGEGLENITGSIGLLGNSLSTLNFRDATTGIKLLSSSIKEVDFGSLKTGVKEFGKEFVSLGKALLTNPIFLLGTIIVLLITKFDELKAAGGFVGKMFTGIGDIIGGIIDLLKSLTDALGLTNFAATEKAEAIQKSSEKEKDAITRRYDAEIALAKAAGKSTEYLEIQKAESLKNTVQNEIDAIEEIKRKNGSLTPDQQKRLDELTKQWQTYTDDIVKLEQQKVQNIINANKALDTQIEDLRVKQTKSQVDDINLKRQRDVDAVNKSIGDETKKADAIKLINQDSDKQIIEYRTQKGKEASDKYKSNLSQQLSDLEASNKLQILNTQENTNERLRVTNEGLQKEIQFYQEHGKQIGLSKTQLSLKLKELQDQEKLNTKSHNDYLVGLEVEKNKAIEDLVKLLEDFRKDGFDDDVALQDARIGGLNQQMDSVGAFQLKKKREIQESIYQLEKELLTKKMNEELSLVEGNEQKILEIKQRYSNEFQKLEVQRLKFSKQNFQEFLNNVLQIAREAFTFISQIEANASAIENNKLRRVKEDIDRQKELVSERYDHEIAEARRSGKATDALEKAKNGAISSLNKKMEKEDDQVKRKQFKRKQNLEIAQATINAAQSVSQIWGAYAEQPIVAAVLTALAAAVHISTIAKIRSTSYSGDSSSGTGGTVGGASGFSAPSTPTPSTRMPNLFGVGSAQALPPNGTPNEMRVYVVETDISKTQNTVSTYQQRATVFE